MRILMVGCLFFPLVAPAATASGSHAYLGMGMFMIGRTERSIGYRWDGGWGLQLSTRYFAEGINSLAGMSVMGLDGADQLWVQSVGLSRSWQPWGSGQFRLSPMIALGAGQAELQRTDEAGFLKALSITSRSYALGVTASGALELVIDSRLRPYLMLSLVSVPGESPVVAGGLLSLGFLLFL